jgi:hypothetical protein
LSLPILTVHRYLQFGILILPKALSKIPKATLMFSFVIYFQDIKNKIVHYYGEVMKGYCIVIDETLYALKHDDEANAFYLNAHANLDYNGWKSCICKKSLYFFYFNRYICWNI